MPAKNLDYYDINESLTDTERLVRDTTRDIVKNEFLPVIRDYFRRREFPKKIIRTLGNIGYLGAELTEYGCAGLNSVAYGLMMQELERGDSGLRSFVSVQGSLVMKSLDELGSEEQKTRWLPPLASGDAIGCFGLTERDHGSDPASMEITAKTTRDGFLLNGNKMWITNASMADVGIIWAKLNDQVHGFIVEKGTPGFHPEKIENKWSMCASDTSSITCENCFVPEKNMLPKTKGLVSALSRLNHARYGIAWGTIGAAIDCFETARDYANVRKQFGKQIASFQLVQKDLADMLEKITYAQTAVLQLGRLKDAGTLKHQQVSMAKRNNAKMAFDCAVSAIQILGAAGITDDFPVIRHLLNLISVMIYEGTYNIHTLIIGKDITGISAFK